MLSLGLSMLLMMHHIQLPPQVAMKSQIGFRSSVVARGGGPSYSLLIFVSDIWITDVGIPVVEILADVSVCVNLYVIFDQVHCHPDACLKYFIFVPLMR
jgi:hypothetical protein